MTHADYTAFVAELTRLSHALERYKQSPEQLTAKADAYFHVLKSLPLREVTAKADAWLEKESKFPTPAQWKAQVIPQPPREIRTLTDAEAREYRRAESLGYEDAPCTCPQCLQAGVSEKHLRFVPDVDRDERDELVRDPIGNRIVVNGHWAHGRELAGYYRARADFWNKCGELGLIKPIKPQDRKRESFQARLDRIFSAAAKVME